MNKALILLGSNQGSRQKYLRRAAQQLEHDGNIRIMAASMLYQSAAWGFVAEEDFLNQALLVATYLPPMSLLRAALAIEAMLGRQRAATARYASRTIDIDILLYEDMVIVHPQLQIPHPRMHLRRFALMPAAEIAAHWQHPIFDCSMQDLLCRCQDDSHVRVIVEY